MKIFKKSEEQRLREELARLDPKSDDYKTIVDRLTELEKANPKPILSGDTVFTAVFGLITAISMCFISNRFGMIEPKESKYLKR